MRKRLAVILLLSLLPAPARSQTGPQLTQSVVAGGGGVSAQGSLRVEGVVGQPASGESSGGPFTLAGGFKQAVAALAQPALAVSDAARAEGNAGATAFAFTVMRTGDVALPSSVDFTTQDGAATTAGSDYAPESGTLNFSAGETAVTVTVSVNGDAAQEENETFFINLSNPSNAIVQDGQGAGTILNDDGAPAAGQVLISEFRLRGPAPSDTPAQGNEQGQLDEFIELYNNTDSDFVVADVSPVSAGAAGWAVVSSDDPATPKYVIPAGTRIPARSHFLVANALGYSLSAYAPADNTGGPAAASYSADIPDGAGLALFRTGSPAGASADDLLDRVGFLPAVPVAAAAQPGLVANAHVFFEGAPLSPAGGVTTPVEHSFFRRLSGGRPQDTQDNAADFQFVATDGGAYEGAQSSLGAPGPQNVESPAQRNATVKASLIDATASNGAEPNSVRKQCGDAEECVAGRSDAGTFSIRRRWTNNTGGDVTALRFRIVGVTTLPQPAGTADLRALSSGQVTGVVAASAALPGVTVEGTTLESPSSASLGGGLNSTLAAGTITPAQPLAPGASVNLQFLLGVRQPGGYRFFVNVEALPVPGVAPIAPAANKSGAARRKAAERVK